MTLLARTEARPPSGAPRLALELARCCTVARALEKSVLARKKSSPRRPDPCAQLVHKRRIDAMSKAAPRVLVLFARGFEELETVAIIDVLRRASMQVTTASPTGGAVEGAHAIRIESERRLSELTARDFDAIVLPGGSENARTLSVDPEAQRLIREARNLDRVVGAICAAPIALKAAGAIRGSRLTSYPGLEKEFAGERYVTDRVVKDGRLITSRGPGTAVEFALALVTELSGAEQAAAVAAPMLVR
jgi:DJ-1 family protein